MALLTTVAEVKAVHPRLLNKTSKDTWLPNFEQAEYKYLVPVIGTALYNDIQAKYTANTLAGAEITLHGKIKAMLVPIAYYDELPRDVGKITDAGPQSDIIGDQKLFGWQYREMKQGIADLYFDALEVLLRWLYDNKASFPLWTGSQEYTRYSKLLIKNGTDFSEQYALYQPLRMYWTLRPLVQDVQDNYHSLALGTGLLNYFIDLAAPTEKEKEILRGLKKSMAFFTVYRTCRMHSVRFGHDGFAILQSDTEAQSTSSTAPQLPLMDHHMRAAEQDGYQQMERAKKLCKDLRAAALADKGAGYDAAFDAGPLVNYATASIAERNDALTSGVRLGI